MAEGPVHSRDSGLIDGFVARQKGSTATGYGYSVRAFYTWCEQHNVDPLGGDEVLFALWDEDQSARLAAASVHTNKGVIQRYYKYLVDEGKLAKSPIPPDWRPPLKWRPNPDKLIPPSDLRSIEAAAKALGAEHVVVTRLITEHGLLGETISNIQVEDLAIQGVTIWLNIPNRRGTALPQQALGQELAEAMREVVGGRSTGPLLVGPAGGRTHTKRITQLLAEITDRARLPRITATVLRQSQSILLLERGVPASQVEARLGVRARHVLQRPTEPVRSGSLPQEVVTEMLGVGTSLIEEAGAEPAASVIVSAGALEYFLRRLSHEAGVTVPPFGGMLVLATALQAAGTISREERREIEIWTVLRDAAVRGEFANVSAHEARRFHEGCIAFADAHRL